MFALLAALVMLLPSAASAHAEYYCRMMGRVVGAASCANEAAGRAVGPASELRLADCCQRLKSATGTASLGTREVAPDLVAACHASAPSPSFELGAPSGRRSLCAAATQAPLAIGPPLFLAHCALLS